MAPLLDVLCYEIESPFASEVLASIELAARGRRIGMVLTGATESHLPEPTWVDDVLQRAPVGVVLVACALPPADKQRLRSRNIRRAPRRRTYRPSARPTGTADTWPPGT